MASALILAYGGFFRNSKAMQIYIYSTIFLVIIFIAGAIWAVVEVFNVINSSSLAPLPSLVEIANAKEELINETCNGYRRGTSNYYLDQLVLFLLWSLPLQLSCLIFGPSLLPRMPKKKSRPRDDFIAFIQHENCKDKIILIICILIVLNCDTFLKT